MNLAYFLLTAAFMFGAGFFLGFRGGRSVGQMEGYERSLTDERRA